VAVEVVEKKINVKELREVWSRVVNSKAKYSLNVVHFALYAALRGSDWKKGLTPITNIKKLANGHKQSSAVVKDYLRYWLRWYPAPLEAFVNLLDGKVTLEEVKIAAEKIING
jgi:hypothetical protein